MIATMRRGVWLLATVVLAAGCAVPSATVAAPSNVERLTDGLPAPVLAWHRCPDEPSRDVECAELAVPRDYRDPAAPALSLAVTRVRATDPAARRGVLVTNPGGPGAPARFNALGVDALAGGALRSSYDLVGLDPRGVGASTPARCGLSGPLLNLATGDPTAVDVADDTATARAIATSCARTPDDVSAWSSTANAARDMDLLRAALGEARLSFYGTSYGTSLGTAYSSVFPDHTDRVVLDSQDDDTTGWRERLRRSNAGLDARFDDMAARISADGRWALGSAGEVRARYLDLRERAIRGQARLGDTPVTPRGLRAVLEDAARQDGTFVDDLADLLAVDGRVPGAPDERALAARLGSGGDADAALGPDETRALDQQVAAGLAVICGDSAWPRDPEAYRTAYAADAAAYPVSQGARAAIRPCAFWPTAPRDPLPVLTTGGPTNLLILQNRADPATPLDGALATRRALGSRAVMITTSDGGHGVFGRNRCATDAAVAWLVDGELPAEDRTCA